MKKQDEIAKLNELTAEEKEELLSSGKERKPRFVRMSQIKPVDRSKVIAIKSGIAELDGKIGGFNLGEMSIISGTNGSGKSSWLSQIALEAGRQGHRTIIFSGELTQERVKQWLMLPAAGIQNLQATEQPGAYGFKTGIYDKIEAWLDKRMLLYENSYGTKADDVINAMAAAADKIGARALIVDNLMSLDVSSMGYDKYERQANFANRLSALAKRINAHIFFVCHPRKSYGFLRKEDISGSADLTNAADNVLIIHRVNTDFKKRIAEVYDSGIVSYLSKYDNVIEVCKNRDLGVQDITAGMYFEQGSRRFLNQPGEMKRYGWETSPEEYARDITAFDDKTPFESKNNGGR